MFGVFKNIDYFCSVIQLQRIAQVEPRSLGASEPRSLGASEPRSRKVHLYINRSASRKYLIYSLNTLKSAKPIVDCAGIRRMEFGQPSALRMRTCEGKEVHAIGCAKE